MSTLSSSSSSTTTTMKANSDEVNDDFMMRFANSLQPTTTTNAETRNRIDDEESGKRAESAPDVVDATAKLAISSNPTQVVTEVSQFNYYLYDILVNMSCLNMTDDYYHILYIHFWSIVLTMESVYLKLRIKLI